MPIRNMEAYIGSLPDWAMLDGCFGTTRITPTDIDGCVERMGQFLFLEHKGRTKTGGWATVSAGQLQMFRELRKRGDKIIIFWGDVDPPTVELMRVFDGDRDERRFEATLADLKCEVAEWFTSVECGARRKVA